MGQTVDRQLSAVIIASVIPNIINTSIYYCSTAPIEDLLVPCLLPVLAERNSLGVGSMYGLGGSQTQHGDNLLLGRYWSRCVRITHAAV